MLSVSINISKLILRLTEHAAQIKDFKNMCNLFNLAIRRDETVCKLCVDEKIILKWVLKSRMKGVAFVHMAQTTVQKCDLLTTEIKQEISR